MKLFYDLIIRSHSFFTFVVRFISYLLYRIIISRVVDFLIRHTFYSRIKFRTAVRNYTLQIKKVDVNTLQLR